MVAGLDYLPAHRVVVFVVGRIVAETLVPCLVV